MLCGLGGCSVEGKQWGWVHMVIGQYRWWVGGWVWGVLNRCFFYTPKKTIHLGEKKTTTTIQDIKERTSNPFYPL